MDWVCDIVLSPEGRNEGKELPKWQGKLTTGELYTRTRLPAAKMLVQMLCGVVPWR
jgi:hypothetical protein